MLEINPKLAMIQIQKEILNALEEIEYAEKVRLGFRNLNNGKLSFNIYVDNEPLVYLVPCFTFNLALAHLGLTRYSLQLSEDNIWTVPQILLDFIKG